MKSGLKLYLLFILISFQTFAQTQKEFQVQIKKNIEFLELHYFLAGYAQEILNVQHSFDYKGQKFTLQEANDFGLLAYETFKDFEANQYALTAKEFSTSAFLDLRTFLLIGLDDFPNAKLNENTEEFVLRGFSPNQDLEEGRKNAEKYINALNELYKQISFDTFLEEHQEKYEKAVSEITSCLPSNELIAAVEDYYRSELGSYNFVPSLIQPIGFNFGVKHKKDGKYHAYHVMGRQYPTKKADNDMGFKDKDAINALANHEFGHSFANPAIDALPEEDIKKTEFLLQPIYDDMASKGYGQWKNTLYEHLVHAGQVMVIKRLEGEEVAKQRAKEFTEQLGFKYLPIFLEELEKYENNKAMTFQEAVNGIIDRLLQIKPEDVIEKTEKREVTITVTVPNENDDVFIAGNREELGNWQPEQVKLKKVSALERSITLKLDVPAKFKFTRGDWATEGAVKGFTKGANLDLKPKEDNQYSYTIDSWRDSNN